jgi:hypothetical protein
MGIKVRKSMRGPIGQNENSWKTSKKIGKLKKVFQNIKKFLENFENMF